MLLHDRARELRARHAVYRVVPRLPDVLPALGERRVVLCVDPSGPIRMQDHLTPDQADQLADALRAVAAEARALAARYAAAMPEPAGSPNA